MTADMSLTDLEQHWGIRSRGNLIGLPETGASMFRWTYDNEPGDFKFRPVRHNHYLLSLILQPMQAKAWAGRRQVWSGPIARHTVRIVHPDDENRWLSPGSFDLLHIMIPRATIAGMFGMEADDDSHTVRFNDPLYSPDEMICQIGRQMLSILDQDGPFVKDIADGLCHALVAYILRRYVMGTGQMTAAVSSRSQIRRALDMVAANLAKDITLEQMAEAAGMSPFHFSREFRKSVGTSPHRYIVDRRIERAKKLLGDQNLSILEVSLECGFKDASHFARVFRATVGMTPRDYRTAN
jgi:AraC family transcriptional regulator